jgi:YD repeat-containing protein
VCIFVVGGCLRGETLERIGTQKAFSVKEDYTSVYYLINARAQENWQGTIMNATILLAQGYIHPAEETARVTRFSWNQWGRVVDRTVHIDKTAEDACCVSVFSLDKDGIADVERWLRAAYRDVTVANEARGGHD